MMAREVWATLGRVLVCVLLLGLGVLLCVYGPALLHVAMGR